VNRQRIVALVLAASAVYGMASAVLFALVFGPFAGRDHVAEALWSACFVAVPYASMYLLYRVIIDRVSLLVFAASTFVIAAAGAVLYSGGFGPNDGAYSLVFRITPLIQFPFVLLTLGISMWQRRASRRAA
jgi:hypothetical protein